MDAVDLDALDFADPPDPCDALSPLDREIDAAIASGESRESFCARKSVSLWPAEAARLRRNMDRATLHAWPRG